MLYRQTEKHPEALSILGFGCMRFPRTRGFIDEKATFELLQKAVDSGVNYFDTAYIYPGSEDMLGRFLERSGCRDRINIATKLPHYLVTSAKDIDKIFNEQLRRLRTDHIDYYLMHMLPGPDTWERMKGFGIEDWILRKKANGQIKHLGFSYHGNSTTFCKLVDAYDWDFCQIQYNYLDENSQAGRAGLEHAAAKGLPVIIMEPLRGGRLADKLPTDAARLLRSAGVSPAVFAFRWLWDQPGVTVILSGMETQEALRENLAAVDTAEPGCFTEDERKLLDAVKREINAKVKVGCTGCGYCMPCPKGVDIPGTFRCYNERYTGSKKAALSDYFKCTTMRPDSALASQCIQCGRCKKHCPQAIDIPEVLKQAAKELESPLYRAAAWAIKKSKRV